MSKQSHRFHRQERLKKETVISQMFNREGQSTAAYPLRLIWIPIELDSPFPIQFALSVPKRKFPKAVDRNRIRRQIREAYRLNKSDLYDSLAEHPTKYGIMVLYTGQEALPYETIERKLLHLFNRFRKQIRKPNP